MHTNPFLSVLVTFAFATAGLARPARSFRAGRGGAEVPGLHPGHQNSAILLLFTFRMGPVMWEGG
jgi:hypothetical protein